jgi:hypothetical protein
MMKYAITYKTNEQVGTRAPVMSATPIRRIEVSEEEYSSILKRIKESGQEITHIETIVTKEPPPS